MDEEISIPVDYGDGYCGGCGRSCYGFTCSIDCYLDYHGVGVGKSNVLSFPDKLLHLGFDFGIVNLWMETNVGFREHHRGRCNVKEAEYLSTQGLPDLGDIFGKKGLDVGCGACSITKELVGCGALMRVTDISPYAIVEANKIEGVLGIVNNSERLPFADNEFDFTICTDVIEHIVNFESAMDEIVRVTKFGGVIVVSTPNIHATKNFLIDCVFPLVKGIFRRILFKDPVLPSRGHIHLFNPNSLRRMMKRRKLKIVGWRVMSYKDVSRNRNLINPIRYLIGLLIPSTLSDQMEVTALKEL